MKKLANIKAILFDFGGTIDTDGIHWSEMFWECYQKHNIPITKIQYEEAYRNGEPNVDNAICKNDTFKKTLNTQIYFQFEYLFENNFLNRNKDSNYIDIITDECYKYAETKISEFRNDLEIFSNQFSMALVSNFYGNIAAVLKEFNIDIFFGSIVDSSKIGICKPDPEIFNYAIKKLNMKPANCVVIGDSYSRDIEPAKKLGCSTIWLDGKSWSRPSDTSCADFSINSVTEIKRLLSI